MKRKNKAEKSLKKKLTSVKIVDIIILVADTKEFYEKEKYFIKYLQSS
ncbi:hypothetical protein [Bacillus benzoevorans]